MSAFLLNLHQSNSCLHYGWCFSYRIRNQGAGFAVQFSSEATYSTLPVWSVMGASSWSAHQTAIKVVHHAQTVAPTYYVAREAIGSNISSL